MLLMQQPWQLKGLTCMDLHGHQASDRDMLCGHKLLLTW